MDKLKSTPKSSKNPWINSNRQLNHQKTHGFLGGRRSSHQKTQKTHGFLGGSADRWRRDDSEMTPRSLRDHSEITPRSLRVDAEKASARALVKWPILGKWCKNPWVFRIFFPWVFDPQWDSKLTKSIFCFFLKFQLSDTLCGGKPLGGFVYKYINI